MKNQSIFVLGDGDNIRETIESLLFSKNFKKLSAVSEQFTEAIKSIKSMAISNMAAEVIMAGGDDVLFILDKKNYARRNIEHLAEFFKTQTGNTMSFGVGETIETAYLNLRKAKASGNNTVIDEGIKYE